jgi:DNA-binding Lrp family transcriptional regulator
MREKSARIQFMDELDAGIIRLLQSDARRSNRELARRLGIAPSTCLERVRALTRRGVIRGYHAEIDLNALNRGVQALVAVQVRPLRRSVIDEFKDSVAKLPEVMTAFVIAGGDDFLLHVAVQDLDHLHAFLLDRLSKRAEIIGFRTSVIFQRVHNTVLARLPDAEHVTAEGTHLNRRPRTCYTGPQYPPLNTSTCVGQHFIAA